MLPLAEIEGLLESCLAIREAAVVAR
jgi:hypothetical protein